jgi:hypothetical protein
MCATDDSRRACSHAFGNPVKPPSLAVEGLTEPPATSSASLYCMKDPASGSSVIAGRLQ